MPSPKWKPGQSGNPKGRTPGTQHQKRFREAITDAEFTDLIRSVLAAAQSGDMQAAGLIFGRLVPALKPTAEPITVPLPADGTLLEQALSIMTATAGGHINSADGKALLDGLAAVAKIQETTDLLQRIEALENKT